MEKILSLIVNRSWEKFDENLGKSLFGPLFFYIFYTFVHLKSSFIAKNCKFYLFLHANLTI